MRSDACDDYLLLLISTIFQYRSSSNDMDVMFVGPMARRRSDGGANIQLFVQQFYGADPISSHQPGFSQMPAHTQGYTQGQTSSPSHYIQSNTFNDRMQSAASAGAAAYPLNDLTSYHSSSHLPDADEDDDEDNEAIKR